VRSGYRRILATLLAGLCCVGASASPAKEPDADHAEQKLQAVRAEIRQVSAELNQLKGDRDQAARELRDADRAVAESAGILHGTEATLKEQQGKLDTLSAERDQLAGKLGSQRASLAELVRLAYAMGRDQRLKLLLAQDRVEQAARALAYQRYIQRSQIERIRGLLSDLESLRQLSVQVDAERQRLDNLRVEQQGAVDALAGKRAAQQKVLDEVGARYHDREKRLAALGRDEKTLVDLIERLHDVFADIPPQPDAEKPLAQRRGKLPKPLTGRIRSRFGGKLPDGRPSRGWLIDGKAGDPVHVVAYGRVAFADWLRGYGLIVIIDHGDGFLSLYAQNESLLKSVGDWVHGGETVATVGRSGGQSSPALYFELRRNGNPVDPAVWLKR